VRPVSESAFNPGKGEINRAIEKDMLTSFDGTVSFSSKLTSRDTAAISSYVRR
jgi:hypothetical protein